jgi:hypothetical protein
MLTALAIENAKPKAKPYKLSDGNGLHLLVNPNGSKLWRLRYRFGGKQNMLGLGAFPEIPLATARSKRDDTRKLLANGIDPSVQKRLDRLAVATAAQNTFGAIVTEHLTTLEESGAAAKTYSHFLLDAGDLVMATSGVTWGKVAFVAAHHLPLCLNTSVVRFRPLTNNTCDSMFLRAFSRHRRFDSRLNRRSLVQPNQTLAQVI